MRNLLSLGIFQEKSLHYREQGHLPGLFSTSYDNPRHREMIEWQG